MYFRIASPKYSVPFDHAYSDISWSDGSGKWLFEREVAQTYNWPSQNIL